MLNQRLSYIDFAAGIMILWMIIYHALCYSWGFDLRDYWGITDLSFLPQGLKAQINSITRGMFLTGKIPINGPLWFLLTLFLVRCVANLILPDKENKCNILWVLVIVITGYVVSFGTYKMHHPLLPLWIANGASGLAFFAFGYGLSKYENKWWLALPCIFMYLLCSIWGFPMVDMMFNKLLTGNYLLWMPVAFCGIVAFNAVCKFAYKYIRIKAMEIVGQNAMTIYVTHILIVLTSTFLLEYFDMEHFMLYTLWIILGGYAISLPVFCYLFNRIGNKN